jgi:hypothetical protein
MWRAILSGTILGTALFLIGGQITRADGRRKPAGMQFRRSTDR